MKRLRFSFRSKKAVLATVAAVVALGIGAYGYKQAHAVQDCSGNSIIKCGEQTPKAFINQVKANNDNNGHHDLQAVYSYFGLEPKDYDKFVSYAEMGTDYRDGHIVVNGQTVATNSWSIGRYASWQGSGYFTKTIDGKKYYGNYNDKAFGPGVQSIPVMVMFNSKGEMQFAAMTACGNPAPGKPITPKYSCDLLQSTHVSGNTYSFSTKATATNNAKLVKVVYNFGDGTTATETSLSMQVKHTYSKAGDFTATVTVYVSLPGKQTVTVTSAKCKVCIKITPPPQVSLTCNYLTATPGAIESNGDQSYKFVANGSVKNATITGYTFNVDGANTTTTSSSLTKTFQPGSHNVSVTVNATANGKSYTATSNDCKKSFTVKSNGQLACDNLTLTPGTAETNGDTPYTLTATASATNATITSYAFNFGDGSNHTVNTANTSATTTHTYTPGNYNVTVLVTGKGANGNGVSASCTGKITVKPPTPVYACDGLTATAIGEADDNGNVAYKLVATAIATNATISGYTFDFGDGSQAKTVTTSDTSASTTHTYAPSTNAYTTRVTVNVTLPDGTTKQVTSDACQTQITVQPPTCTAPNGQTYPKGSPECAPTCTAPNGQTYPAGSPNCEVCQYNNKLSANSAQCTPPPTCKSPTTGQTYPMGSSECQPTVLPNTGAGSMLGIFAGASLAGGLAYRFMLGRRLSREG